MDKNDVTADEAAKILGVTPAHVRWYHRNGHLPGERIGKILLVFKRSDVEKLRDNKPKKTGRPKKPTATTAKKKPPTRNGRHG